MGHALGFNGWLVQPEDSPADQWGPAADGAAIGTFDEHVERDGDYFFFVGAAAMADYRGGNNTYTHVGNDGGPCPMGRSDLMTGYPWKTGFRYAISRLDLAILKDLGLPVA